VTVLTTPEDADAVNAYVAAHGLTGLRAQAVPLPPRAQRLLDAPWFSRLLWFVVYLLWLRSADVSGRRLHEQRPFDVTMHVAYGSYWLPSPVVDYGVPSIWGPVGGATSTPLSLWRYLGVKGVVDELAKLISVRVMTLLPSTRRTWRRATVRIAETPETVAALPVGLRGSTRVANRAMLSEVPPHEDRPREPFLLFPSRLQGRKGARLVLRALARAATDVELRFVNTGPEEASLTALARQLRVADRARFLGRIPRDELFDMESRAAGIVFAGLREEGGCALAEAMQMGVPVVVVAHGGARLIAESGSDPARVALVTPGSATDTEERLAEAMTTMSHGMTAGTGSYLDRRPTVEVLHTALDDALATAATAATSHPQAPSRAATTGAGPSRVGGA
jgi:glycosyltransferase involved in cell wall biosynthesis